MGERANTPINYARRMETNSSRMHRQSHLTLFKMCLGWWEEGNAARERTHAPIDYARRIEANSPRMQRQFHTPDIM